MHVFQSIIQRFGLFVKLEGRLNHVEFFNVWTQGVPRMSRPGAIVQDAMITMDLNCFEKLRDIILDALSPELLVEARFRPVFNPVHESSAMGTIVA
jgi:hypothetical protein